MVHCRTCGIYQGTPECGPCRTLKRVQSLVRSETLGPSCEGKVLSILRGAAGELADLLESRLLEGAPAPGPGGHKPSGAPAPKPAGATAPKPVGAPAPLVDKAKPDAKEEKEEGPENEEEEYSYSERSEEEKTEPKEKDASKSKEASGSGSKPKESKEEAKASGEEKVDTSKEAEKEKKEERETQRKEAKEDRRQEEDEEDDRAPIERRRRKRSRSRRRGTKGRKKRHPQEEVATLQQSLPPSVQALRNQYQHWDIPRNLKKAVSRGTLVEVQGAQVDGQLGVAYPRESKLLKYAGAVLTLLDQDMVTQKQLQVVCGGLVYFSMFRRQLLGCLNSIWQFIESFNVRDAKVQKLPDHCRFEIIRMLALVPLARMNFRLPYHQEVTCSDASTSGGGVCVSQGLTCLGTLVASGTLRGQLPSSRAEHRVLTIGLFDGIGGVRVAIDLLGAESIGHISIERSASARRVVESHFPEVEHVETVEQVDSTMMQAWSLKYSQAAVVLVAGGPPCQGVSGLNSERKGALRDVRSSLFVHVRRTYELARLHFPWAQVHGLMESVASMDSADRDIMSADFGSSPWTCDAGSLTWCSRPRLYWTTWDLFEQEGAVVVAPLEGTPGQVTLHAWQDLDEVCEEGWTKVDPSRPFPTFTTSRPRDRPGRKPAGVTQCTEQELDRWQADSFRFPPYQYAGRNCLINGRNELRLPSVREKEYMLGFPVNYTAGCLPKAQRKTQAAVDERHTLLGNTWSVPVVAWFISQLLSVLGIIPCLTPQDLVDKLRPQAQDPVQVCLWRTPLRPSRGATGSAPVSLVEKLGSLVSVKGEDLLLTAPSSELGKFHRLRSSVPSKLWKWRIVAGWRWANQQEHINGLELRAALTALKWRIVHKQQLGCRFLHLTDSLVVMPRRILEGSSQQERANKRQALGTLQQLTVQPATKNRYNKALDQFFAFLRTNDQRLPRRREQLDPVVCEYLEHLWSQGFGRALASDTVAALQDFDAKIRGHLPGAWRLLRTWSVNEIPNRAPPLPEHVLHAMVGWAFFKQHFSFGASLLVGFYGMLRTGELVGLRSSHVLVDSHRDRVVISLGFTKSGKRQGAAESCVLGYDLLIQYLRHWKTVATTSSCFCKSPRQWRMLFSEALSALKLESFEFRPYSLRRGGATWWFGKHHSLDQILVQGRWQAARTARVYINEGMAALAEMKLPKTHSSQGAIFPSSSCAQERIHKCE
eukprot:Skav214996  [mRNA]  locus=scaffold508:815286:819802:- [translate_table: standard]